MEVKTEFAVGILDDADHIIADLHLLRQDIFHARCGLLAKCHGFLPFRSYILYLQIAFPAILAQYLIYDTFFPITVNPPGPRFCQKFKHFSIEKQDSDLSLSRLLFHLLQIGIFQCTFFL